ncbi:MAG: penicillin-binding transpeptidase domain-containing protein [Niabella sp.]
MTEQVPFFKASKTGEKKYRKSIWLYPGLAFIAVFVFLLSSCTQNNVKQDDSLKKHFDENNVTGCFALLDNGTGVFTVYNLSRYRDSAYLPASTFKIVNSLIGLQTGKIISDSMVIPWDGVERPIKDWNKDLNMYEAFRVSSLPYYQEVARRIGKDTMQYWLDSLHYGSGKKDTLFKISGSVDSFWINNTLKITPDENLGLVKKLYFNELPFFKLYQEKVKNAMLFENNANYKLAYKTGWGFTEQNHSIGWIVGWIEENKHPYFFVLNIESPDADYDMWGARMKILKGILKDLGFFEGKM